MKTKHILLTMAASAVVLGTTVPAATAQIAAFRQGGGGYVEGYSLPRTVVTATLVIEREVIIRGPYARYASQYLGVSGVAMTDKQSYRIIDATLGYFEEPDPEQTYHLDKPVGEQTKVFRWLTSTVPGDRQPLLTEAEYPNATIGNNNPFADVAMSSLRTSAVEKSPEQMAAEAAQAIFTLRQRRFDLVTGEGNDLGAGLKDALAEMARIENNYMELFIGKRYTQRIVRTFSVLPQPGKGAAIVCRFSDTKGVVPDTDLSAKPIVIEMTAEASASGSEGMKTAPKGTSNVRYRVPEVQLVKLVDGSEELARERIPVFQFGGVAYAPVIF